MNRMLLAAALLVILAAGSHAQDARPALDSLYRAAQSAWDEGQNGWTNAELTALRGLRVAQGVDDLAAIEFHRILGFIYASRAESDRPVISEDAVEEFLAILWANRRYDLDPLNTPGKIIDDWREAKTRFPYEIPDRVRQLDMRMSASWRSLAAPGWGQCYKTQDSKGAAVIAAQVLSLAALMYMQTDVNRRHKDYLAIRDYDDPNIQDRYDEYRRAYRMRNVIGYITLGIYVANYLDALYTPVKRPKKLP